MGEFNLQAFNPTLLAALASPNIPDYAGRMSQMDLNSAQREKMLAELAYLPMQREAEAMKTKVYALQQGYIMNPDGTFTMTPAKKAQMDLMNSILGNMGGGQPAAPMAPPAGGGELTPPAIPESGGVSSNPWMQAALGIRGPQKAAGGIPDLTGGYKAPPIVTDDTIDGIQPPLQSTPGGRDLGNLGLAAGVLGNSPLVSAVGNLQDQDIAEQKIQQNTPEYKGKQKMLEKVNETVVTDLNDRKAKADEAILSLQNNDEARTLLDSGVITGTGAAYLVSFGKALDKAGVNLAEDEIANTEAFVGLRAAEVGRQIKQFGAGTGLSDADREYATQAAAGKISLNEKSIRKIIDISDRANKNVIKLYNKKAGVYSDVPEMAKAFQPIEIPEYKKKETSKAAKAQDLQSLTDDELLEMLNGQ